ncbi:sensor histidine kinase [Terrisporobacter mayombei]|uniref:histidine kinase n=1 Tax=Terrisporobacter mayombei TaxID=1541 RepID=A0ABY9Q7R7_9FIRM|nr:HAMP domain-containing sensor histidine kinase [Terrisporobacter mayombei]MCC3869809.1 HAMP domain-containing histidine kinase [Terrisporobacter mayombei]WMT83250.1 Sensor histidine kinase RcsC [Terrisporobacter mayombei]
MGEYLKKIVVITFTILIGMNLFPYEIYASEKRNVLFITTYSSCTSDFEKRISGIKEGLEQGIDLHTKYFSESIIENKEEQKYFVDELKNTLQEERYDAIIVGDYYTLKFAIKNRDEILKDLPIIFFGVSNNEIIEEAISKDKITGVKQALSIESTINLIRKYHPFTNNIVVINNYEDSKEIEALKNEIIPKFKDINFKFIYTSKLSENEFKKKIKHLDENNAILTIYPNDFKNSNWISDNDINELINETTNNIPIYNLVEEGIGSGSIGGKVVSIYSQCKKVGEIARDFIEGKKVKPLYISDNDANKYMFDYINMSKSQIKPNMLPEDSKLINSPKDFITLYKGVFIFIILFVVALIIVIITLIRYLAYKKKHEEILKKAMKEIEEINKLKNHFIINMNHELKTPITVINSVMQLTKYVKKQDEKYFISEKNIVLVEDNCQRLLKLVNNIIDLEKIDSQEINLNMENVNIVEVIEDTVLSVVPYAQARNIDITFDTKEEEIIMSVDKNKIERVVLNLLSNGIKYSKEAGFVDVRVYVCENNLHIVIEDDGIGIDDENLNKIFDRFVRVDNSLARTNEGSGIGLSIVKAFVDCHNGNISAKSIKNVGTSFIINIPIVIKNYNDGNDVKQISTDNYIKQELADIYL